MCSIVNIQIFLNSIKAWLLFKFNKSRRFLGDFTIVWPADGINGRLGLYCEFVVDLAQISISLFHVLYLFNVIIVTPFISNWTTNSVLGEVGKRQTEMISTSFNSQWLDDLDGDLCSLTWMNITNINSIEIWIIMSILHQCCCLSLSNCIIVFLLSISFLKHLTVCWILIINLNCHFWDCGLAFFRKFESDLCRRILVIFSFRILIDLSHVDYRNGIFKWSNYINFLKWKIHDLLWNITFMLTPNLLNFKTTGNSFRIRSFQFVFFERRPNVILQLLTYLFSQLVL